MESKKSNYGRKPIDPDLKRAVVVGLPMTDVEKKEVERIAMDLGHRSSAGMVREAVNSYFDYEGIDFQVK